MKTPSAKAALALAIALVCAGTPSTAFAKAHAHKAQRYAAPDTFVNRPFMPSQSQETCLFPDWRCSSANGNEDQRRQGDRQSGSPVAGVQAGDDNAAGTSRKSALLSQPRPERREARGAQ